MFDENDNWKEFGFSEANHTWFPFWLFCIVWAILSYSIINFFLSEDTLVKKKKGTKLQEVEVMKPGYYALDKETTSKEGFPKYVYIGPKVDE